MQQAPKVRMGRQKIDIRFLDKKCIRMQTFRKRAEGIFKKAIELHVLCGAEIELSVKFEDGKKDYMYSSVKNIHVLPNGISIDKILSGTCGNVKTAGAGAGARAAKAEHPVAAAAMQVHLYTSAVSDSSSSIVAAPQQQQHYYSSDGVHLDAFGMDFLKQEVDFLKQEESEGIQAGTMGTSLEQEIQGASGIFVDHTGYMLLDAQIPEVEQQQHEQFYVSYDDPDDLEQQYQSGEFDENFI